MRADPRDDLRYARNFKAERRARGVCVMCAKAPLVTKNHCEPCRVRANAASEKSKAQPFVSPMEPPRPNYSISEAAKDDMRRSLDLIEVIARRHRVKVADVVRVRYGRRGEEQ
jgi:hypothetical protein